MFCARLTSQEALALLTPSLHAQCCSIPPGSPVPVSTSRMLLFYVGVLAGAPRSATHTFCHHHLISCILGWTVPEFGGDPWQATRSPGALFSPRVSYVRVFQAGPWKSQGLLSSASIAAPRLCEPHLRSQWDHYLATSWSLLISPLVSAPHCVH